MIAIKDMEMPSCCENCGLCLCLDDDISGLCYLTQTTNMDRTNSRNSDCPLVEIVTCKNCKYWHDDGIVTTCDRNIGNGFPRDYYCANGERREQDEN
jgi:hypothetical protein